MTIACESPMTTLEEFGVTKTACLEKAAIMSQQALASGSPGNNPIVPTQEEIVRLYEDLYA